MGKFTLTLLLSFCVLVGSYSSAVASNDAKLNSGSQVVVFGKFRLLKNGQEITLGEGLFGNVAALRLYRTDDQEEFTVRVGKDGEFSRMLSPGEYYVMSVSFKHQGETIQPDTNFRFDVSADGRPNYLGTLTFEATFSSGYHGSKGRFDRYTVSNDCAIDCARRLAELDLAGEKAVTSLPEWQTQVAFNR